MSWAEPRFHRSVVAEARFGKYDLLFSVFLVELAFDYFAPFVDLLVLRQELDDLLEFEFGESFVFNNVGLLNTTGQPAAI